MSGYFRACDRGRICEAFLYFEAPDARVPVCKMGATGYPKAVYMPFMHTASLFPQDPRGHGP